VSRRVTVGSWCFGLISLASACSEAPPQRETPPPPPATTLIAADTPSLTIDTTAASQDTALGRCDVVLRAPTVEQEEVIRALRAAYGLEGSLYQAHRGFPDTVTREEVFAHYRQGFGRELAEDLTNYSWGPETPGLRPTERALAVPDSVGVLDFRREHALVAWIPPTAFRQQWGVPRCLVDRMVREDGRWIIQARVS